MNAKYGKFYVILIILAISTYFALAGWYLLECQIEPLVGDALNYHKASIQLINKNFLGYNSNKPNAFVTPLYPLMISIIYKLHGFHPGAVRWFQVILGAFTVMVIADIARRITSSNLGGVLAGWGAALYPTFVWSPSMLLTETLFNFCFMLYLWIQIIAMEKSHWLWHAGAGAAMAMTTLVRPNVAPLLIIPYIILLIQKRNKKVIYSGIIAVIAWMIVMSPWWIRNLVVLHKWVPLSEGSGNPLLAGSYPWNTDFSNVVFPINPDDQKEMALNRIVYGFSHDFKYYFLWYTVGHFKYTFSNIWMGVSQFQTFMQEFFPLHTLYIKVGAIGSILALKSKKSQVLLAIGVVGAGMQFMFLPLNRYAYPWMSFAIILSSLAACYLFNIVKVIVRYVTTKIRPINIKA